RQSGPRHHVAGAGGAGIAGRGTGCAAVFAIGPGRARAGDTGAGYRCRAGRAAPATAGLAGPGSAGCSKRAIRLTIAALPKAVPDGDRFAQVAELVDALP